MGDIQGTQSGRHGWQVIPRVLSFVLHHDRVLLLRGAPDKRLWAHQYNGLGGHVEREEDVWTAALREIHEEGGPEVENLRLRAVLHIDPGTDVGVMLFVFLADARTTHVHPSEEGTPEWIPLTQLSDIPLVDDVAVILPRALDADRRGTVAFGHYTYDAEGDWTITWAETAER